MVGIDIVILVLQYEDIFKYKHIHNEPIGAGVLSDCANASESRLSPYYTMRYDVDVHEI